MEYLAEGVEPGVRARFEETLRLIEELGGRFREMHLPHTAYALAAYYIIAPAEASANLARFDGIRYGHRSKEAWPYRATRGRRPR